MSNIIEEIRNVRTELYKLPLRIDVKLDRNAAKTVKELEERLRLVEEEIKHFFSGNI
jgi:hypothetical protein